MTIDTILCIVVLVAVAIFFILVIAASIDEDIRHDKHESWRENGFMMYVEKDDMTDTTLREKMAKDAYRASQKSLKLDMMQAEALRQMRDVADEYDADFIKTSKKSVSS